MYAKLVKVAEWLRARAENLLAAMLGVMFFAFIAQIVFRYVFNVSVGWSNEISVVMWLWMVLFGAAFVVREVEEIRLDFIYSSASRGVRRAMALVSAASLVVLFTISLPAIYDYVTFMKVERTAYLKIRFDVLYSAYLIFAVAMIVRYLWLGYQAIWGKGPEEYDPTKASSGV